MVLPCLPPQKNKDTEAWTRCCLAPDWKDGKPKCASREKPVILVLENQHYTWLVKPKFQNIGSMSSQTPSVHTLNSVESKCSPSLSLSFSTLVRAEVSVLANQRLNHPNVNLVRWNSRSLKQPTNAFEENKVARLCTLWTLTSTWNRVAWMNLPKLVFRTLQPCDPQVSLHLKILDQADKTECPPSMGAVPYARRT